MSTGARRALPPWRTSWRSWWATSGTNTTRSSRSSKKQEDGSYLIACSADLDDMFDLFAVKGACAATTVSGWVMEQVGRVPEEGDHFQAEGLDVIVTRVEHRRVIEIQVRVLPEEEPETK